MSVLVATPAKYRPDSCTRNHFCCVRNYLRSTTAAPAPASHQHLAPPESSTHAPFAAA